MICQSRTCAPHAIMIVVDFVAQIAPTILDQASSTFNPISFYRSTTPPINARIQS